MPIYLTTWAEAHDFASTRRARKLANNTTLEERDGDYAVRLHSTDVVTFHADGSITLRSDGWQSATTKDRLNRYTPNGTWDGDAWRGHTIRVWQDHGLWYVSTIAGTFDFEDGMTVQPDGSTDAREADVEADRREYRRERRMHARRQEQLAREMRERRERVAGVA